MPILDQHGNPLQRETLSEPQTSRLGSLQREFATHPSRGLTPSKLAAILEQAEAGDILAQHDLFLDMEEKDAHVYAEMSKRKRAILTVPWSIEPPRNASAAEKSLAAEVEEMARDIPNIEDVLLDMMDGVGHGFACLEIEWAKAGRDWLPKAIEHRPQAWFRLDTETRTQLRLRDLSADGAPLQPFGWIAHVHRAKSGYIARAGLHRILAWPYLYKNYSVRDLAEFLEIYGLPLRLGKYPPGASDKEKSTLLAAVVNIGHNAAGIIPEGMAIEIMEAAKGSHEPFQAMMQWAESSQSKAILGGTLTSQADGKSSTNALGNVHNEVRHDLLEADARQLAATLNDSLIHYLVALNKGGVADLRRMPRWVFDTSETEDIAIYADAIPKLVQVGMPIPASWVRERLGIPEATDGEAVLSAPAQNPPPPGEGRVREPGQEDPTPATMTAALNAALSSLLAAPRVARQESEFPDQAAIDAARPDPDLADAAMAGLLQPIFEAIRQGESYEQILAEMGDWYPRMDDADLVELLTRALFAAEVWGRLSAEEEMRLTQPAALAGQPTGSSKPEAAPPTNITLHTTINMPEGMLKPEIRVDVAQPSVQIDNHIAVPEMPAPVVQVAAPAVTVENQVVVPPRETVTEIERDADGNIVRAVQRDVGGSDGG